MKEWLICFLCNNWYIISVSYLPKEFIPLDRCSLEERTTGVGIDKNDEVFALMNQLKISNRWVNGINFTFGGLFQSKSKQMILIVINIVSVITNTIVLFIILYAYHIQMGDWNKN
jgi:hypothetical protein